MSTAPTISTSEAAYAREAAHRVVVTHQRLAAFVREGQTLAQIDAEVARILKDLDCRSCFLGYRVPRMPAYMNHACLSVNECIVHGTSASYTAPLKAGDLLSIDIGVKYKGWIGDAAWTYAIKEVSDENLTLMRCGIESLRRSIPTLAPGNQYIEWARTCQHYVETECGFHIVRGLGGHGIGRKLHGPPFISNNVPTFPGEWPDAFANCEPGTLIAVEPMIAVGTGRTLTEPKKWPILTFDNSMSVHYEADVLITEDGPENLTEEMYELPDVVG
ncbi:MAG: type I methionyl aminopeptidase [Phycisphaerales bacterium]